MGLKINILSLGKTKQQFVSQGEEEYLKRLRHSWKIEIKELDSSRWNKLPPVQLQEKEAQLFLENVPERSFLIMLDERGKLLDSAGFATVLSNGMSQGNSQMTIGIGGAYGWSETAKKRAQLLLSLSPLTFTYQMSRLILIEQLYRAYATLNGINYQK